MVDTPSWSQGYVTDTGYTHGFYRELSPAIITYALRLAGRRAPDIDKPFTYCELGFGQGMTLNALAAAFPHGEFWGTDFNPDHAAQAKMMADGAGLSNLKVFDASFQDFAEAATPQFDFIVFHGIWSWIIPEARQGILDFVRKKLKVGGAVYISFNALPGWGPAAPLRHLLYEFGRTQGGGTVDKIDKALDFATKLVESKQGFFGSVGGLDKRVEQIRKHNRRYVAHEYFNEAWTPDYFSDIAASMGEAKLSYAGSANPLDGFDHLNLSATAKPLLAEAKDPIFREVLRDFLLNRQFRRDLFLRGNLTLPTQERSAQLLGTRFVLTVARSSIPEKVKLPLGEMQLKAEIYDPLLDALAAGPVMLSSLIGKPEFAKITPNMLIEASAVLTGLNYAHPVGSESLIAARKALVGRLNQMMLGQFLAGEAGDRLISPVTGSEVVASVNDRLFVEALQAKAKDPVAHAANRLTRLGLSLNAGEKRLTTVADIVPVLTGVYKTFTEKTLPVYKQHGIL
ncbi:class I SAM-dependent methyltransferase [Lacibacterium aquatile]|uniref:Class I SAM-dependent methyltransferase n=1 Tax=Lacibacterium aquatile TaxID=1168082 RepID=A0ABW5DMD8_9PROT